jgi:hypothetical protein
MIRGEPAHLVPYAALPPATLGALENRNLYTRFERQLVCVARLKRVRRKLKYVSINPYKIKIDI